MIKGILSCLILGYRRYVHLSSVLLVGNLLSFQIIHDVSGTPFTQSNVVADSYRYFAPEVCMGNGNLSTATDIYALAMTVLEVL